MISIDIHKKLSGVDGNLDLHFNTTIREGDFVTIYGSSGAGKTSVIRMIAGLLTPDEGEIVVNEVQWFDKKRKINLKPQMRNVGMVFQDYSLFPNMTVRENLEFALHKGESKTAVNDMLEIIELIQLADQKPSSLSGGQKQRVALARAIVRKPRLLLLDEPLSALDLEMQLKLQDYIMKVHEEFKFTTILISHDLPEVLKMSKRVIVLKHGKIENDGKPGDVLPLQSIRDFLNSWDARNADQ